MPTYAIIAYICQVSVYIVCIVVQTTFSTIEIVNFAAFAALAKLFLFLFMAPSASSSLRMCSGACPSCGVKSGV